MATRLDYATLEVGWAFIMTSVLEILIIYRKFSCDIIQGIACFPDFEKTL